MLQGMTLAFGAFLAWETRNVITHGNVLKSSLRGGVAIDL